MACPPSAPRRAAAAAVAGPPAYTAAACCSAAPLQYEQMPAPAPPSPAIVDRHSQKRGGATMSRTQCWTEQLAATLHAHLYSPTVQRRRTAKDYVETGWFIFLFTFFL